jgi:FecR protein
LRSTFYGEPLILGSTRTKIRHMKITSKILVGSITSVAFLLPGPSDGASSKEARVTQIIREVKLLPADAAAREAAVNDKVSEDTGVRTGGDSRSELTFPDLTITRLGANTIFSFSKSGRTANVDTGSILLRVPKDSGGGTIRSSAVTVAVTGTTVIFEGSRGGRSKLITLEGSSRVSLKKNPKEFRKVLAGQMIDVPAGATTLPMPVNVDLNQIMRTHPLITDFKPLPSQPLIMAAAQQPQPEPPPPSYTGPIIPILPVITFGPNHGPNRDPHPSRTPHPVTNQPPGTTKPPTTNKQPTTTPTAPPILTRTNPKQTYTPAPTKTPTRVQKVTKKPTPPPIR